MCNVAALVGVLVLSVRLVKPSLDGISTWRLALALTLPALLLNPVLITIGFGQVNLFVTFLVMWDLLSERRIGRRQLPLGLGHRSGRCHQADSPAVRPLPGAHPALAWRSDLCAHLRRLRGRDVRHLSCVLEGVLDEGGVQARAAPATSPSSTTRTSGGCSTG